MFTDPDRSARDLGILLPDETATERLAMDIAVSLMPGDLVPPSGDLGAGKTTLARSIIRTLAEDKTLEVPSPTFTLLQLYELPRFPVVHADLYRVKTLAELSELAGRKLRKAPPLWSSRHATGVSAPVWAPDGSLVYFLASDPPTADERERDRVRDDVYAFDETFKQRHLWNIAVSTGAESQLTTGDATVIEYKVSADGRHIAYERAPSPSDGEAFRAEVWAMDAAGTNGRALTHNAMQEFGLDISPDGSQVLFTCEANERFESYYPAMLFSVPTSGAGAARPCGSRFSAHVRVGAVGARRQNDGRRGEHGRSQRVLPDRYRDCSVRAS